MQPSEKPEKIDSTVMVLIVSIYNYLSNLALIRSALVISF